MMYDFEAELQRLVAVEEFERFHRRLARYTATVSCAGPSETQRATEFLQQLLVQAKARRAHIAAELAEALTAQSYAGAVAHPATLDVTG